MIFEFFQNCKSHGHTAGERICLSIKGEYTDLSHGQDALRTFKTTSAERLKSPFGRAMFLEHILSGQYTASVGLTRPLFCR